MQAGEGTKRLLPSLWRALGFNWWGDVNVNGIKLLLYNGFTRWSQRDISALVIPV